MSGANLAEYDASGVRTTAIQLTRLDMWFAVLLIAVFALLAGVSAYAVLKRTMPLLNGGQPVLDFILFIGSFLLPFLAAFPIKGLSRITSALSSIDASFNSLDYSEAGLLRTAGFVFILLAVGVAVGLWWDWRRWLPSAVVFYSIFVVLFTTVFTNGNGLASGMVGSLGYWLEQQNVQRFTGIGEDRKVGCHVYSLALPKLPAQGNTMKTPRWQAADRRKVL